MKYILGFILALLLLMPGTWAYSTEEYNSVNASIYSAGESIKKVEKLVANHSFLASDLEVSLRLSEAKLKKNISESYLLAAMDANNTNPGLGNSYLNFASTSALEAKSLADSAQIISNAKILSTQTEEAQLREKIEAISEDLSKYSENLDKLELELSRISKDIEGLKKQGISLTTIEERYQEAKILRDNSLVLFNSSREDFDDGNYDDAKTGIKNALARLNEAKIKTDSANSLLSLAKKEVSSQVEDVDALINEAGELLKISSGEIETASKGLSLVESFGLSVEGFKLVFDSNVVHQNSAKEYYEKAVFRRNLQDFQQAKEFTLLALEELNIVRNKKGELFESILIVSQPQIEGEFNSTATNLSRQESIYHQSQINFSRSQLSSLEEALSSAKISLAEGRHSRVLAERQWDGQNLSIALELYLDSFSHVDEAKTSLFSFIQIIDAAQEKEQLEKNLIILNNMSGWIYSGISSDELGKIQSNYNDALIDLENEDFSSALGKFKIGNMAADDLIESSKKSRLSLQRGGLLLGFSLFLFGIIFAFEIYTRLKR